ncbi:MAG: TrkH family potassium uptake protein [Hyphomicrobiales bacterium]|nr:TrkH family potassium uptake protein [Hyphomicrobiales bacterium]
MLRASIQFILYVNGLLLCLLAMLMILPALVDLAFDNPDAMVFAVSALLTFTLGALLAIANKTDKVPPGRTLFYLLTVSIWLIVSIFASIPLALSSLSIDIVDVYFETVSGLTTTGSTILVGLDHLPPGLLLWRSLLQWFGGIGIVVMAMVVLPALRVGGMQLFRTESSDISGKILPRARQIATVMAAAYVSLTLICAIALHIAGMSAFDAVNHALTTLSTGGFSTHDASIGDYDSVAIETVTIVFMALAAMPIIFFARIVIEPRAASFRDEQVRGLLMTLLAAILVVTAWNFLFRGVPLADALRDSAFSVTAVLTGTGYSTVDFSAWGSFAAGVFFFLFFIGGCAGSTAGGIKIFRWQIMLRAVANQLRTTLSPNRIVILRYRGQSVDPPMRNSINSFFFLYLLTYAGLSLAVMATGLDFVSAASAVAQAIGNVGPGLGPLVGPATTFAGIPDSAKLLLVLSMLVGRLELITLYVILTRDYWD